MYKLSERILVVGGGLVGVEMAGELATDYEDKKIILITRNNELVESASSPSLPTATRSTQSRETLSSES